MEKIMIEDRLSQLQLTSTERVIADYVLSHRYEVANYTIGELADITYSSNASIIRLCKKLGYSGYKSFLIDFIKETEAIKSTMKNVNYDYPFEDGTPNEILRSLGSLYKEASDLMIHSLDVSQIEKGVKLLTSSKRIFMFASGDTLATTNAFVNRLVKLNLFPIIPKDETQYILPNISKEDVVLFVSYGLKSKQYESYYEVLSKRNIPIITIRWNHHGN